MHVRQNYESQRKNNTLGGEKMNNLAQKHQRQQVTEKQTQTKVMKVYRRFSKGERLSFVLLIAFLVIMSVKILSTQAAVYEVNKEIVDLNATIEDQLKTNTELREEVSDLSKYERIGKKAQEDGFKLNEKNIKVVEKQ